MENAEFTVDERGLFAPGNYFTFHNTSTGNGDADGSVSEFRQIDASQITRIEAVQKKINTARVQAGSQYAALESAVIYTTDLTAHELDTSFMT